MKRREFLASSAAAAAFLAAGAPVLGQAARQAPALSGEDARLAAMLDAFFYELLALSPEWATGLGLDTGERAGYRSRLDDYSAAGRREELDLVAGQARRMAAIDRGRLSAPWATNYDVVAYGQARSAAGARFPFGSTGSIYAPYVISQLSGPYRDVPDFLDSRHPVETPADAEAYLARLDAFTVALDQSLDRQRADAALGVFAPDFALDTALAQLQALRSTPAASTTLVTSIARRAQAKGIAGDFAGRATLIVEELIFPAIDRQLALVTELRSQATHVGGVWRLTDGEAYYAEALEAATTTRLSPEEVHRIGVEQVAELTSRLDSILTAEGWTRGTVGERLAALNADPKQLYPNTEAGRTALIADLNAGVKATYARLGRAFATLPRAEVEIRRVPPSIQDGAPNGYYYSAPLDRSRPALYWINLKDTADWPKYTLPTLSHHEAVPGHHLQISLALESDIPLIRRNAGYSAYTEGWALYAEQLADELGAYEGDPLGRAGMLQSYLFRASRLVVDTGLHHKRWSREQATEWMVSATGMPRARTQREIDRYCVWPGQACSYKVGHNMWARLRAEAQQRLGSRFDVRDFHAVLLEGAMPLDLLERRVMERVRARQV